MKDEFLSKEEKELVEEMLKKIRKGDTTDFMSIEEMKED